MTRDDKLFLKLMVGILLAAAVVIGISALAHAQVQPSMTNLSMRQVEDLNAALVALADGTPDQCSHKKDDPPPPAPTPGHPDPKCPFHISDALMHAMSQNRVALRDADLKFQVEDNAAKADTFASLPIPAGASPEAINSLKGEQNVRYLAKMIGDGTKPGVYQERVELPSLSMVKWSDLNSGDPPEHNHIAPLAAALAPMIADFDAK